MLIGYARVSTQDQNLDLQREALTKAGCEKIMEDQISGARAERPGLLKRWESSAQGIRWWSGSGIAWDAAYGI